jgi:ATP phosphoribosyltransferase regulatory subunit
MLQRNPWLLPDGFEEILPDDARRLEQLRSKLLKVFASWGYELVIPPFIDYLQTLLTGSGHDLDLQTFKLTDQLNGEMLGIRADMTPQIARIDSHHLKHDWPNRLCYAGTVLRTIGDPLEKTRSPMQIGAELYGHKGIESDIEIIQLMLEMLAITGLESVHLDLGHVSIFRELAKIAELSKYQEAKLFDVLQRKARPELAQIVDSYISNQEIKELFLKLPELNGDSSVLTKARECFAVAGDIVLDSLTDLQQIADKLAINFPMLTVSFDLAELRGYHYHTGVVFSAFIPTLGKEVARGGRYDNIGAIFGRARAATGFSSDLKLLNTLVRNSVQAQSQEKTFAPAVDDQDLGELIRDLRADGHIVIQQLSGQIGNAQELGCDKILENNGQKWIVTSLTK